MQFATAEQQRDDVIDGWALEETEVVMSGPDHRWTRYENDNGTVFEFAQHDWECGFSLGSLALRGHCFPGSKEFLGCGETNPWNWGEAVIQFYKDHPAP